MLPFLVFSAALLSPAWSQLSPADIAIVAQRLAEGATQSWELGTRAEALIELNATDFSVFSQVPPPTSATSALGPVFSIAHNVVAALKNSSGPASLVSGDGAAGDPAAIGVAVLLANWTGQGSGRVDGLDYAGAAANEVDYLLNVAPRTSDGAISHRAAQVQLWSDNVYMVPPFLAYYGVLTSNTSLITAAYDQIKLYRNYLRDSKSDNLWKHIVLGNNTTDGGNDEGHWSTGNGWAAAGMLRVLATMKNSPFSKSFSSQQKDLASWVKEIHSAMFANIDSTNIFTNYADQPITTSGMFYDTASTCLIAATVYRLSLISNDHTHLPNAEKCRLALFATKASNTSTSSSRISQSASTSSSAAPSASASAASLANLVHFTSDGWLTPVVNPDQFGIEGQQSPEGAAFVLELQAAYSEWVAGGSVGANTGSRTEASTAWIAAAIIFSLFFYA
ncbi:Six-hairpin glycosidase-like protein [Mycena amicta]|nr:Six-hairpin glycosidase-like protein [Mycena amicta]